MPKGKKSAERIQDRRKSTLATEMNPQTSKTLPIAFLIGANLVPLIGVLAFQWDARLLVLAYWFENLVIGFYTMGKMLLANKTEPGEEPIPFGHPVILAGKLFMIGFFMIHFGGFCAVHGLFILVLTGTGDFSFRGIDPNWPGPLVFLGLLLGVLKAVFAERPPGVEMLLAALFLSHGLSFFFNYIGKGEFRRTDTAQQMGAPYSRIVVIHIAILAGAAPVMALGSPLPLLLLIVAGKVILDIQFHRRSHRRKAEPGDNPETAKVTTT